MVILCLTYREIVKLFSTVAAPFYIPATMYESSNFSTSLPTPVSWFWFFNKLDSVLNLEEISLGPCYCYPDNRHLKIHLFY